MLTMQALFGSYFASPDVSVFMRAGDPQPWDLDQCRAARCVYAAEPDKHSQFRDGMVKKLTGGDPVTSARKYGHPVTWKPQCLLVFGTNHPIWFDTSDDSMFGRAKPIEFIYAGPLDPSLPARLKGELPGILTWALHGLNEYLIHGPPEVTPSMARLREKIAAESDPALRFVSAAIRGGYLAHDKSRTVPAAGCVKVSGIYPKFTAWAHSEGVRNPVGKHAFNERVGRVYRVLHSNGERFTGLLPGPRFGEANWLDE
jgi:putative DNA primase/helicase